MNNIKKIEIFFQQLLKEISEKRIKAFSGLGLVLYNSKFFLNIPRCDLRPSSECPKKMFINKKNTLDFFSIISKKNHPWHDGYHFFNEKGKLTHISQYIAVPINLQAIPNEMYGARHLTAQLVSHIKGVIAVGIINSNYNAAYFEKGRYNSLSNWDVVYKNRGKDYQYYDITKPHKDIDKIIKILKKEKAKKLLDLGCGGGKDLIYLNKKGFEMYGIDCSKQGIKTTKDLLEKENLKANLKIGDIFRKLPYSNDFFDAVISVQVLQHGRLREIKKVITEIKRVLKPRGILFVTLCGRYSKGKIRHCIVRTAKKIEPKTYIPTIGNEVGVPHYIYNVQTIKKHYQDFKIIDMWKDDKDYYCFLGKNKK